MVSGGSLLELKCPSSLVRSTEQQVSFARTLGGKRKGFVRKGGRRAWSVDVSVARPGEVSTLEAVARGLGPYGWYPPEAVRGNLLSPQASSFEVTPTSATRAGLVQLPDGTVAETVVHSGSTQVYPGAAHGSHERVPVHPGGEVSVGVWALGGAGMSMGWRDAQGTLQSTTTVPAKPGTGWQWFTATATAPASAAFMSLGLTGGAQYARPSVSWGVTARDELGTGCPLAVIHSPSHTPVALWEGANYTATSYTVTEVG